MKRLWLLITALFVFYYVRDVQCLRDVRLIILPKIVQRGRSATLLCLYELEGAPLYSVKWYRGTHEFYRYSPSERPPNKVFRFRGINVDEATSNSSQVVLRDVNFGLAGNFSCEVTTDAPSFSNRVVSQQMDVVALPLNRPVINTDRPIYEPGDILKANCTSPPSKPPAELTFHINGHPIPVERTQHRKAWDNESSSFGELTWSIASTTVQLQTFHFLTKTNPDKENDIYYRTTTSNSGNLHIACTARIPSVSYYESTILKLASKIGEPVHQRVMSESFAGIAATATPVFVPSIVNWLIILVVFLI